MTGALVNAAAIVLGGACGHLFGRALKQRHQQTLTMACGVSTLFLGISGAMQYMLHSSLLPDGGGMLVVACLALGGLIGEMLNIERGFETFGEWLKVRTGNTRDPGFVNGFVVRHTSLVCEDIAKCKMINLVVQPDGKYYEKVKTGNRVEGYRFYWTFTEHPSIASATEVHQIQTRVDKDPTVLKVAKDILKGEKKKRKAPETNPFNRFDQNQYDFDELEKELLRNPSED